MGAREGQGGGMSRGEVLSNDQIAALVEAARTGDLPEEPAEKRRQRRVRVADFTRPTKFTTDQERRLRHALDTFARSAGTRMSADLRTPVELEVISTTQMTWAHAHDAIPAGAICAVIDVAPIRTRMLLATEAPFILLAIERMLGGTAEQLPHERRMTDIDSMLAHELLAGLVSQLSLVFADLAELELDLSALDSRMEVAQLAPVSEPTLALTVEAKVARSSSTLTLLIPHRSIAQVEDRIHSREDDRFGADDGTADAVRAALAGVEIELRAEVGAVELPIQRVLALQPGDTVRLERAVDAGVTLFADEVAVHQAQPGRSGTRRAVQIAGRRA